MVRKNTRVIGMMTAISTVTGLLFLLLLTAPTHVSADNVTFEFDVKESLTISVTTPNTWASGDAGNFLRNTVTLTAASNNATGLTATMYASDTSLINVSNSSITLPTLSSSATRSNFTDNKWGYSLDVSGNNALNNKTYNENDTGNDDSNYYPLTDSSSPESVLALSGTGVGTRNIYFGAKSTTTQASGTYVGTVVISVITGTVNTNPDGNTPTDEPSNPATPGPTENTPYYNNAPTGDSTAGSTTYTYTTSPSGSTTTTTTTQVSKGNNTDAYTGYTPPAGVTNVQEGTPLATGLAVTSAVAATTGIVFFIIAKRREDEEDEEEY